MKLFALAATTALLLSTSAQASDDRPLKTEISVSTVGVDFQNAAEVAAFEARMAKAARRACASGFDRSLRARGDDRACAAQALRRSAIVVARASGKPALAADEKAAEASATLASAQ